MATIGVKTLETSVDNEILYGANAAEWLKRWDEGKTVWTIEMGGLGPGYEQCITITTAELLRHMLAKKYDIEAWKDENNAAWKHDRQKIEDAAFENETIKKLGLSGAQYGAALSLASYLYINGPVAMMLDERVRDRHIQASKSFPS